MRAHDPRPATDGDEPIRPEPGDQTSDAVPSPPGPSDDKSQPTVPN